MAQQQSFIELKQSKQFGGILDQGKRRKQRPLSTKHPIHLVLKCQKRINLFANAKYVESKINQYADQFNLKLYSFSIQRDHIHFSIGFETRDAYIKFVRSLTGNLARHFGKGLWKLSPYTRVLTWGRDFKNVQKYIQQNELEARGAIPYQPRQK